MMQESRKKKDKDKHREIEKKRRDKDKLECRGKHREHGESISESDAIQSSPVKRVSGKRKSTSKDTDETSSSDTEWKQCGSKGTLFIHISLWGKIFKSDPWTPPPNLCGKIPIFGNYSEI